MSATITRGVPVADPVHDRQSWLAARRKGVGASEAGAIFGISPWATPLQLYMEKLGMLPETAQQKWMKWGLRIESVVADVYAEETGRDITIPHKLMQHADHPFMLASLDRVAGDRVLEIKRVYQHVTQSWGPSGSREVPEYYYLQVQQQMAVAGYELADIAAFFGDAELRIYTIERNDEVIAKLVEAERDFMRRIEERDPPMPDWEHPTTADLLAMLEPSEDLEVELPVDVHELVDQFELLGVTLSEAKKAREELKSRLIYVMGEAQFAKLPDGRRIKRNVIRRAAYSVDATSYVDFRVLKAKKKGNRNVDDNN